MKLYLTRMTIDSGWVKILKKAAPHAFSAALPAAPGVVFIDGQIKLMKGEHVKTWKHFVELQFFNTIDRCFETGAHTVVLGFDNYEHVPTAKNMTQRKRSQHVPVMDFTMQDDLPAILPASWDGAMRNRSFKVKVMNLVAKNVRLRYATSPRTVVIDFTDEVEVVGKPRPLPDVLSTATKPKRGECDIKAFAFLGAEPLLISSTDGDFVPLSLMQIERAVADGIPEPRVLLFRIKVNVSDVDSAQKRKRGREMEYIDVNALYAYLQTELAVDRPAACFSSMVASTGCDFTMNLPQIGPAKLWTHRHVLKKIDTATVEGVLTMMLQAYTLMFQHKARMPKFELDMPVEKTMQTFDEAVVSMKRCTQIAQRARDSIWEMERALAHAKNTQWTVLYWKLLHEHPDPINGDYGFIIRNGAVNFGQ